VTQSAESELEFHCSTGLGEGSSFETNEKRRETLDIRKGARKHNPICTNLDTMLGLGFHILQVSGQCTPSENVVHT
jgi:hypothetical protein